MILIRGREAGRDGETQGREGGRGGRGEPSVRKVKLYKAFLENIKEAAALPTCFIFLSFVTFSARRRTHGSPAMTKPMRTLLGKWPNNIKVKGLICADLAVSPHVSVLQRVNVWILY